MKQLTSLCLVVIIALFFPKADTMAQSSGSSSGGTTSLPQVFKLGDYSQQYEMLVPGQQSLLWACGGDMKSAHAKLYSMMRDMETFAKTTGYDLDGVKAWLHFFFREDGSIRHIGFHLKPNSKNVDVNGFSAFLTNFSQQYKFPIKSAVPYSHYSTFSFPVL